jgi:hypothetical protein
LFIEETTSNVFTIVGGAKALVPNWDHATLSRLFPGYALRPLWQNALGHIPDHIGHANNVAAMTADNGKCSPPRRTAACGGATLTARTWGGILWVTPTKSLRWRQAMPSCLRPRRTIVCGGARRFTEFKIDTGFHERSPIPDASPK